MYVCMHIYTTALLYSLLWHYVLRVLRRVKGWEEVNNQKVKPENPIYIHNVIYIYVYACIYIYIYIYIYITYIYIYIYMYTCVYIYIYIYIYI